MSAPVPRHRRNPLRAYDAEGREMPPATVGHARAQGDTTVMVDCVRRHRHVIVSTDGLPDEHPIPDIALRLRCSACGSQQITVMMDMTAHYARLRSSGYGVGGEVTVDAARAVLRPFVRPPAPEREKGAPAEAGAPGAGPERR